MRLGELLALAPHPRPALRRVGEWRHLRLRPDSKSLRQSRHAPQLCHRLDEVERRRIEADHGRQDGIRHWLESRGRQSGTASST